MHSESRVGVPAATLRATLHVARCMGMLRVAHHVGMLRVARRRPVCLVSYAESRALALAWKSSAMFMKPWRCEADRSYAACNGARGTSHQPDRLHAGCVHRN